MVLKAYVTHLVALHLYLPEECSEDGAGNAASHFRFVWNQASTPTVGHTIDEASLLVCVNICYTQPVYIYTTASWAVGLCAPHDIGLVGPSAPSR